MRLNMEKLHIKLSKKTWLILFSVFLALLLALFFILPSFQGGGRAAGDTTATVSRGKIIKTIEGTGVIAANDQYTIRSLVTGEVLSDTFQEGDMVEKDALLYVIDSTNLDYTIQKAESGVESARLSYVESLENKANQSVTAPISGVITSLSVKEGDEINAGTRVAEIIFADRMILSIPFLATDAEHFSAGDAATVTPSSAPSLSLPGTVQSVASGRTTNAYGALVTYVEILVQNPGGLTDGASATARVGAFACNEAGILSYEETASVTAKTGGTVTDLRVKKGDRVSLGALLFTLKSDSTDRSVSRSRLSYDDAIRNRDNTYDQLEDYNIKAPISGKVIQKSVKAGDKLDNGSSGNASNMAIIADLSVLTFEISVDELDIAAVKEGQTVQVTADAVEGQTFIGHVDHVSIVGTAQNGVTSYPVKVTLDGGENSALIPGMNVNATIITEEKEDILLIPVSAVSRGNIVTVKGDAPRKDSAEEEDPQNLSADDKAAKKMLETQPPNGYHYVRIETGISDGNFIEVVSGLAEGDVLLLPASAGSENSSITFTQDAPVSPMQMRMGAMGGSMGGDSRPGMNR